MPKPHLDIRDIGLVLKGIGRGRRPKGMQAESVHCDPGLRSIPPEQLVDPIAGECAIEFAGSVVAHGPEQRPRPIVPVPGEGEGFLDC